MKQFVKIIFVLGLGVLMGCQSIERRNDTIKKQKLAVLTEAQTQVVVSKGWVKKVGKGVGKRDPLLMVAQADDVVVAADHQGNVYQIDKANGQTRWHVNLNRDLSAGPSIADGFVFVATSDGELLALKLDNGELKWERNITSEVVAAPFAKDGVVFVHSLDGGLTALNTKTGRQLWRYSADAPSLILRRSSPPVVGEDRAIAGFANGKVVAFRRVDGDVEWTRELTLAHGRSEIQRMIDVGASPVIAHGNVYAVSYQGKVACLTLQTGEVLWERDFSSYSGLAVQGDRVIVAGSNGEIWGFDAHTGGTLWVQEGLRGRRLSHPVAHNDWLIVGDDDGVVHWLNVEDGHFGGRSVVDKSGVEAPVVIDGQHVFVFGKGGKLTALYAQPRGQQGSLPPQT